MKRTKKIISVIISAVITCMLPSVYLSADENFIISSDDERYKYLENADGTISIAESEYSKEGIDGDVVLPSQLDGKTVTAICDNGFLGSEITSVTVPESICSIGSLAFANCLTLSTVELHDNISYMGELAFSNTGFETNLLSDKTSEFAVIEDYILYLYTGNKAEIIVPDDIRVIANSAFANNGVNSSTDIVSVTMDDGVEYIGDNAFENCTGLKKITIKTGLKSVGENAIDDSIEIHGYINTYAQQFAEENGNTFVPLIAKDEYQIECEYGEDFKQYYFSTDTEFSKEGITVYRRNYDGTKTEITDWEFDSTPAQLYAASNPAEDTTEVTTEVTE